MHMPPHVKPVHRALLIVIVAISVAMAGCMAYPQPPWPGTTMVTPVPGGNTVSIQNFAFIPPTMTVSPGTTVTWVNQDTVDHQVINDASGSNAAGAIFESPVLSNGASYSFTFTNPGIYPYHCSIHAAMKSMKGTIIVR
jgi:plastocyanin